MDSLTGIRFIAALLIVLYHYNLILGFPIPFALLREQGRSGVGLFFVLSGFILVYNYQRWFENGLEWPRYFRFIQARFARVFPMHAVALAGMAILVAVVWITHPMWPTVALGAPISSRSAALIFLANLALVQVYIPTVPYENSLNVPSWSIACEAVFYAVFPFFVAGMLRPGQAVGKILRTAAVLWGFELVLAVGVFWAIHHRWGSAWVEPADFFGYRMPLFRMPEFLVGCCAGAIFSEIRRAPQAHWIGRLLSSPSSRDGLLTGSFVLGSLLMILRYDLPRDLSALTGFLEWYALYTPLFAVGILCLASGPTFLSGILGSRIMVVLGEASYSLYIIHWVVLYAVVYGQSFGLPSNRAVPAVALFSTILLSILFWRVVEGPARRWLRPVAE